MPASDKLRGAHSLSAEESASQLTLARDPALDLCHNVPIFDSNCPKDGERHEIGTLPE